MPEIMGGPLLLLTAYLIGSIPFGYLLARIFKGIDIRTVGSCNIGATNVGRVLGSRWGLAVLCLDLLKGFLPIFLLPQLWLHGNPGTALNWQAGGALMAILGHMFPCWLGFRGGKGVATGLGVVLAFAPGASLAAFLTFVATFALGRIVSLASILAVSAFGACELWLLRPQPFRTETCLLAVFSIAAPLLIIVQHRRNLIRLWQGTEPRYSSRSAPQPPARPDAP